jgi:carbon monoxide dehydrogenase subunit G
MRQRLTNSINIDRPIAEVLAFVREPSNFNQFMPDVTFSDVSMTPDGVRTTYRSETRVAVLSCGRPLLLTRPALR